MEWTNVNDERPPPRLPILFAYDGKTYCGFYDDKTESFYRFTVPPCGPYIPWATINPIKNVILWMRFPQPPKDNI